MKNNYDSSKKKSYKAETTKQIENTKLYIKGKAHKISSKQFSFILLLYSQYRDNTACNYSLTKVSFTSASTSVWSSSSTSCSLHRRHIIITIRRSIKSISSHALWRHHIEAMQAISSSTCRCRLIKSMKKKIDNNTKNMEKMHTETHTHIHARLNDKRLVGHFTSSPSPTCNAKCSMCGMETITKPGQAE